ncbi:bacterio-opsin activator domain-containing protein [Haladaptatus paucihalophilus]|uniref:PAS domain S-box-containing protein n=1 Tax=Haladaptatus paucihalophilus DX253 TaxID=797209 RepID=A0A1M6ZVB6_HALPU|nr:bacterio-opsin activator domain-containing protein [Haladaptatus paucihalophilus]SHL34438.1 PAS domain S-box-containing protein [Haladaptatus paucihalophilus DX253]
MGSSILSPARVLEVVDTLGPPGTPLTTPEVAAEFDCTDRTVYNKLEELVAEGPLKTKKVGARGRVWWRPVSNETEGPKEGPKNLNGPRERVRSHPVFDSGMVGVIVWGSDFTIRDANDAFLEMAGMEFEEALGTSWRDLTPEEFYLDSERHIEQVEETGSGVPYEKQYYHSDGSCWWGLFESQVLNDSEKVEFVIEITDRKESEVALERLNDASRELINTKTETIADRVASLALAILDVEYAALWRYDDRSGDLEEHAADAAGDEDADAFGLPSEISDWVWQTFIDTDVHVQNDIGGQIDESSSLRSCAFVPLGRHGVVTFGSTQADAFDERTVELAETTAATVETAWNRAQGEHQLNERNDELERLDRLNALIRGVHQHLVDADSRETIEQAVVEQLADSALYEFAWIGARDPGTDTVTPREWAGVDDGYLDMLSISTERTGLNEDPIAAAIRTSDLQVVADVAIDPRAAPWREVTLDRGARSCISIPLRYNRSKYGVLTVYISSPQSDERDHAVLKELGETIAHAIDAVETKRTLLSDSVTELTLEIHDGDDVLTALAQASDCEITFDSLVPLRDGAARLFFVTEDVSAKEVLDEARRLPSIAEVTLLREAETESVFEATVTGSTLASHVIENGGLVRSLTVTAEMTTAIIDQPAGTTVREFVETIRIEYPSADLVARHSRDRPIRTREDMRTVLSERLTDRQREILETAYRSGYFESPRVQTGRDLSEAFDITQSTFSHHLREGERRLCELVFDSA